jgi:NAD(P)H-dependent FMN reductase
MTKILFFSGSTRKGSVNVMLAKQAEAIAKEMGVQTTYLDLKDYPLPLYDGDLEAEEGVPENAKKLKAIFQSHDGVFIASPEYNSGMSPLLKNTIDWISRLKDDGEAPLAAFNGKVYGLGAASPSWRGGLRGLVDLRMLLGNINITVTPTETTVSDAYNAFDESGRLKSDINTKMLKDTVKQLVDTAKALK